MKTKPLVFLAVSALTVASLWGQSVVPLRVSVLPPTPTVVKSGEEFSITYHLEFLDLSYKNEEIIIETDKLQPVNVVIFPFEAVGLDLNKRKEGNVFIWDFRYRMRIVDKEKGDKKIPAITFRYIRKLVNDPIEKGRQKEFKAPEVNINIKYVSTITKEPALDIRDSFAVSRHDWLQKISLAVVWISLASFGALIFGLVYFAKIRRKAKIVSLKKAGNGSPIKLVIAPGWSFCSPRKARKNLGKIIRLAQKTIGKDSPLNQAQLLSLENELFVGLRELMFANFPALSIGYTPTEAADYFRKNIRGKYRCQIWLEITGLWIALLNGLDRQEPSTLGGFKSEMIIRLNGLKKTINKTAPSRLLAFCIFLVVKKAAGKCFKLFSGLKKLGLKWKK